MSTETSDYPQLERQENESVENQRARLERLLSANTPPTFWEWYEPRRYIGEAPRTLPAAEEAYRRFLKDHHSGRDEFLAAIRSALEKLT